MNEKDGKILIKNPALIDMDPFPYLQWDGGNNSARCCVQAVIVTKMQRVCNFELEILIQKTFFHIIFQTKTL